VWEKERDEQVGRGKKEKDFCQVGSMRKKGWETEGGKEK